MPMREVTNTSQGRVIHIDTTMILPGQTALIDAERANSKPVKAQIAANELQLGGLVHDVEEEEQTQKPAQPQPQQPPKPQQPSQPSQHKG